MTLALLALPGNGALSAQQIPTDGGGLYDLACANCHGTNGAGVEPGDVAFTVPTPDFTDCSFSSREPDADWIAVAHEGGPVRAFDETMPAFGEALSIEQLQLIMDYIRSFCDDNRWPRGELNLPRALVTEKAFPEDEGVTTVTIDLEGAGSITNNLLYEKRFGPQTQIEVELPFGVAQQDVNGSWTAGLGDLTVGIKQNIFHSIESGSIFSFGAELKLPTGGESIGLGNGTAVFEPYIAFGQIVASDAFIQLQALAEFPTETDVAASEFKWRAVAGRSWTQGQWGRTWTPMMEILGETPLDGGGVNWDLVPQIQVTLNTRQHVILNVGARVPVNNGAVRSTQLLMYILWDWFDGGFFDGW